MWDFETCESRDDLSLESLIKAHESIQEKRRLNVSIFEELMSPAKHPTNFSNLTSNEFESAQSLKSRIYSFEQSQKSLIEENTRLNWELNQAKSDFNIKLLQKEGEITALNLELQETKAILESGQKLFLENRKQFQNYMNEKAEECREYGNYEALTNKYLSSEAKLSSFKARYEDFMLTIEENRDLKIENKRLQSQICKLEEMNRAWKEGGSPLADKNTTEILGENKVDSVIVYGEQFVGPSYKDICAKIEKLEKINENLNSVIKGQMYTTEQIRQERDSYCSILNHIDNISSNELLKSVPFQSQNDKICPSDSRIVPRGEEEAISSNVLECLSQLNSRLIWELKCRCPDINIEDLIDSANDFEGESKNRERMQKEQEKCREELKKIVVGLMGYKIEFLDRKICLNMEGTVPGVGEDWKLMFEEVDGKFRLVETGYSTSLGYLCDYYLRGIGSVPLFLAAHTFSLYGMSSELSKLGFSL